MINSANNFFRFAINSLEYVCLKVKNGFIHSNLDVFFAHSNPHVSPEPPWRRLDVPWMCPLSPRPPVFSPLINYCCFDFPRLVTFSMNEKNQINQ